MRLYTIRRKSDGKYLRKINGHYQLHSGKPRDEANEWADAVAYLLRTPDGIRANIIKLCSEPYWNTVAPSGVCTSLKETWRELAWRNFDVTLTALYEVVIMETTINSETAVSCRYFLTEEDTAASGSGDNPKGS